MIGLLRQINVCMHVVFCKVILCNGERDDARYVLVNLCIGYRLHVIKQHIPVYSYVLLQPPPPPAAHIYI